MKKMNILKMLVTAICCSAVETFDVRVRNIDYRFITGIKYRHNKITVGLFYQHGLRSTCMGNINNKNNNKLLTLNLLYQLR